VYPNCVSSCTNGSNLYSATYSTSTPKFMSYTQSTATFQVNMTNVTLAASAGDSLTMTVTITSLDTNQTYNSNSQYFIPTLDYINSGKLQNVNLSYTVTDPTATSFINKYYSSGAYFARLMISRNGAAAVEYNPGDEHICRYLTNAFSLVMDMSLQTGSTSVTLYVKLG